ncbi:Uncharacterised protein [uncultured archaeon]|nr:Uncharacterised protein [uncultured archaeon]
MKFKLPIFLILSMFLLSTASALTTYSEWSNGVQDVAIHNGESIGFNVDFFTMNPSMNVKIDLLDSQSNVIHTFLNTNVNSKESNTAYTLDRSVYLGEGTFSIIAQGTDSVGSSQSSEITLTVLKDNVAPTLTLKGANPQFVIQGNSYIELGASATDNVDGDLSSKVTISGSVNTNVAGDYNMIYNVKDAAGNNAVTKTRVVRVLPVGADTIPPVVTIQNPTNGAIYNHQITLLSFIATDTNLASCSYSTDDGVTKVSTACVSGGLTSVPLTSVSGLNNWIVYATDSAGNSASASISFTVDLSAPDTTAPVITIVSPENREYSTNRLTFEITTDETATAEFSIDGGSRTAMTSHSGNDFTYIVGGIDNGNHTIIFYAKDASNNEANKSISFSVHKSSSSGGIGNIDSQTTVSAPTTPSVTSKPTPTIIAGNKKDSALGSAPLYLISAIAVLGIAITSLSLFRRLRK